jgi:hypothetical protein
VYVLSRADTNLFQVYLDHGDRDDCLSQRRRFTAAGEVQLEHLPFGRGEKEEGGTCRLCVWVGLLS